MYNNAIGAVTIHSENSPLVPLKLITWTNIPTTTVVANNGVSWATVSEKTRKILMRL